VILRQHGTLSKAVLKRLSLMQEKVLQNVTVKSIKLKDIFGFGLFRHRIGVSVRSQVNERTAKTVRSPTNWPLMLTLASMSNTCAV
jgi:ribosomal protein S13